MCIILFIFLLHQMRGNKFEKSHNHFSESETLSRESRVTEFAQELVGSILDIGYNRPISIFFKNFILLFVRTLQEWRDFTWRVSDC